MLLEGIVDPTGYTSATAELINGDSAVRLTLTDGEITFSREYAKTDFEHTRWLGQKDEAMLIQIRDEIFETDAWRQQDNGTPPNGTEA